MTFQNLDDVIEKNHAAGKHFFTPGAISYFAQRIESELIAGRYFITSECASTWTMNAPRMYTIREALPDGSISTLGTFMKYKTKVQARATIAKLCSRNDKRHLRNKPS